MTTITAAVRKAANIAAHQERNARSKAEGAKRREDRMYRGISRGWLHNAKLKYARLDALRAKRGLKPYQMTYEQACAFEGASNEGGEMLSYRIPMTLAAFTASLPSSYTMTADDEIKAILPGGSAGFAAMVDGDRSDEASIVVDVEYQIIDGLDGHAPAIEFQRLIAELHEHIVAVGGEIVESVDDSEDQDD